MKCGISIFRGPLLLTLLLGVAWAGPAQSDPIFFDGPSVAGRDGLGIAAPPPGFDPNAVLDALIFPVLYDDGSQVLEFLSIGDQSADGTTFAGSPPTEVLSSWVVNQGSDFGALAEGEFFLLFETALLERDVMSIDETSVLGTTAYDPGNALGPDTARAGLMIDSALDWVVVETEAMIGGELQTIYYPGIRLDFLGGGEKGVCGGVDISAGQACVELHYMLEDPNVATFADPSGVNVLGLPELPIMMAYVPEPGTGALVALGLAGLAAARRRHS